MQVAYEYEDTKLIFRDVSYDEEAAEPKCHNNLYQHNILMRNTSIYVAHPTTYKQF
jgi:hypothetical protein